MKPRSRLTSILSIITLYFLGFTCLAGPQKSNDYHLIKGGLLVIPSGAHMEGSLKKNGTQPDYIIDWENPAFQSLRDFCRQQKKSNKDVWQKIAAIQKFVRSKTFMNAEYDHPVQVELNKRYRQQGKDVPLSEYAKCNTGVCREYALVTHLALAEAGITNYHGYGKVSWRDPKLKNPIIEDHAFDVVPYNGTNWVIDTFRPEFNGFKLSDLMSTQGATENSERAPIATLSGKGARIEKIHKFPQVWLPIEMGEQRLIPPPSTSCATVIGEILQ